MVVTETELSIPAVGLFMTDDHRYFWNGRGPIPSVTTATKVIEKPALTNAIKYAIANRAVDHAAWLELIEDAIGRGETLSWLANAMDEVRDRAAKIGTDVHKLADMVARTPQDGQGGFEIGPEHLPYVEAFRSFLARHVTSQDVIVSSEHAVLGDGYAGTFDLICWLTLPPSTVRQLWLLDVKTSRGVHADYALQLAGYKYARSIVLPNDPHEYVMPAIERCGILHLRPDVYEAPGYGIVEMTVDHREYVAFLAALDLYQYGKEGRNRELTKKYAKQ